MNDKAAEKLILCAAAMAALFAIPQILFFRLVSKEAECRMAVYGFMTAYTLAHVLLTVFLRIRKGIRIAASPILLSTIFAFAELVACAVLLAMNASSQTSVLVLSVLGLIHFSAVSVLCATLEK